MARWKLMTSHYLNVPGEVWQYTENDRKTGRPKRVDFPVPRLLDPADPTCWTKTWGSQGNEEGEVIVCHDGMGESSDIVFIGDPTPDMVPVDDEAKAISASFVERWRFKPEEATSSHSQSLVDKFQIEMAGIKSRPAEVPGLADLTAMIGKLVEQNQTAIAAITRRA